MSCQSTVAGALRAGDEYAPAGYDLTDETAWCEVADVVIVGESITVSHVDGDSAELDSAAIVYTR